MKLKHKNWRPKFPVLMLLVLGLTLVESHANVIWTADPTNITAVHNGVGNSPTFAGTPLVMTVTGGQNNNSSGFSSTDTINTLNGTPITAVDTVIYVVEFDSYTPNIRSNGIEFGLVPGLGFRPADNLLFQIDDNDNPSSTVGNSIWGGAAAGGLQILESSLADGFRIVYTADVNGVTATLTDVEVVNGADVVQSTTGTFTLQTFANTGPEDTFVTAVGNSHFYLVAQGPNGTYTINEASLSVVPEPGSLALLFGLGSLIAFRRRRRAA